MPIRNLETWEEMGDLLRAGPRSLGSDVAWFDAHTHIGHADPDGVEADPEEILAGLDSAGHERALCFAMQEPGGYPPANDVVLEACAASGGRLIALCRVDPNHDGALAEATRCLEAGAVGIKLHPRSDAFTLPHPMVERLTALAAERRAPVLFHAGRGIPNLGEAAVALARSYPDARIILAHAGISDLGLVAAAARELPNLYFDTSWWMVADLLQLMTSIPPGQILYASDMPYGPGLFSACALVRTATVAGLDHARLREIAGGQLARVIAGEDPVDLGPPVGDTAVGPRDPVLERIVVHASAALQVAFRGGEAEEPLQLARLACQTPESPHAELLGRLDETMARGLELVAETGEMRALAPAAIVAQLIAGTARLPYP